MTFTASPCEPSPRVSSPSFSFRASPLLRLDSGPPFMGGSPSTVATELELDWSMEFVLIFVTEFPFVCGEKPTLRLLSGAPMVAVELVLDWSIEFVLLFATEFPFVCGETPTLRGPDQAPRLTLLLFSGSDASPLIFTESFGALMPAVGGLEEGFTALGEGFGGFGDAAGLGEGREAAVLVVIESLLCWSALI